MTEKFSPARTLGIHCDILEAVWGSVLLWLYLLHNFCLFNVLRNLLIPSANPNVLQCVPNTGSPRSSVPDDLRGNCSRQETELKVFLCLMMML